MSKKQAHLLPIINADERTVADNVAGEILPKVSTNKLSVSELRNYEDDLHFEFSFSVDLTADNISEPEQKAFRLTQIL